jgi:hypothetical protein
MQLEGNRPSRKNTHVDKAREINHMCMLMTEKGAVRDVEEK